jgi:hypothetical protein
VSRVKEIGAPAARETVPVEPPVAPPTLQRRSLLAKSVGRLELRLWQKLRFCTSDWRVVVGVLSDICVCWVLDIVRCELLENIYVIA